MGFFLKKEKKKDAGEEVELKRSTRARVHRNTAKWGNLGWEIVVSKSMQTTFRIPTNWTN